MVLLALFAVFYGMTIVRVVLVRRRTGINPVKLRSDDSVHGALDRVLKVNIAAWLSVSLVYAFAPGVKPWLVPIAYLETGGVQLAGAIVAAVAILWIGVAQVQMSGSFRMGVDPSEKTTLVRHGLFSVSRNPIYVGILAAVAGFFLMAPNALSFGLTATTIVGVPIQARLEEGYLLSQNGDIYREYQSAVRRWLGKRRGSEPAPSRTKVPR